MDDCPAENKPYQRLIIWREMIHFRAADSCPGPSAYRRCTRPATGRPIPAEWDVRTAWPGDVVVVEVVLANIDRHSAGPDIGVGPLFERKGPAQCPLHQVHQVSVPSLGADEDECLP